MSHEEARVKYLQEKYGMEKLELDGRQDAKVQTLQDLVNQTEIDNAKHLTLALGSTVFRGKKVNIWFERSK